MAAIAETGDYVVADVDGQPVGHVECPLYGTEPHEPDALAVVSGRLFRHHYVVPATTIRAVDEEHGTIALGVERSQLRRFL